jgi:4-hydroxy 2-oxovalerate aldolase
MLPLKLFKLAFSGDLKGGDFRDYGIKIEVGKFEPGIESCVIPNESSLAYALALACVGGAKAINLVGFDGFGADDIRTCTMNNLFSVYQKKGWPTLTALTPTKYDINVGSLYSTLR